MHDSPAASRSAMLDSSWFRWAVLSFFLVVWVSLTFAYPVYFQRDDAKTLYWSQEHSIVDSFIPGRSAGKSTEFRPLAYFAIIVQHRLFGLNAHLWHLVMGLLLILGLVFMFKLMRLISDSATAYLTLGIWLAAFQFLLTSVFWFQHISLVIELALLPAGLYIFISGFRVSSVGRMAFGVVLMLGAALSKDPSLVILPATTAVYLATEGRSIRKWKAGKAMVYSILPLVAVPLYLAVFPYLLNRDRPETGALADSIAQRFDFYGSYLTSGMTGLLLLIPAFYFLGARVVNRNDDSRAFPVVVAAAVACALAVVKLHLTAPGLLILLAAAVFVPSRYWLLLPWAFLPFVGLLFFSGIVRTYMSELSLALAALAALQTRLLLSHLASWWAARAIRPAITYTLLGLLILGTAGAVSVKAQSQGALLRARSDTTMTTKLITPYLKKLPAHAVLIVVDYESMGLTDADVMKLPDSEKIRVQGSMLPWYYAEAWTKVIGRGDLRVVPLSKYRRSGDQDARGYRVFVWLMTPRDHEYFGTLAAPCKSFAGVRRGVGVMDLVELSRPSEMRERGM